MNLKRMATSLLMAAFAFGTVITPASANEPSFVTPQEPQQSVGEAQNEPEPQNEKSPSEPMTVAEIPFDLHAHVFDYGEAIDGVQIDLSSVLGERTINEGGLTADTFQVLATATDPYNSNAVLYEDVARTVTSVSVENGIVTLNLACQYNGQGQSTLNYSLDAGRNLSADVAYDITLTKDIALSDSSTIAKDALSFSQDEIFNEETAAFTAGNSDGLNYQLYVPENAADGKDHPLIVWFHGGGEGGYGEAQNNTSQLRANRGALGFAEEGAQQIFGGAYVLAPQSPNSWSRDGQESLDHATALINTIVNTYNIDADRIYVAGCSDGGWMTVNMAIENPELFAAIVPICAAFGSSTDEELLTLKDNNIWMVHALNDTSVEPENTSDRLHALIPSSIYTVYDTVTVDGVDYPGHWSWIYVARNMPTHNGQSIFQWMASKTLKEDPTVVPFDLHAHVFDYGEAIDQVQIDLSSVLGDRTIDTSALTTDMFQVAATATDPYNSNAVLYEDVARTVTSVSVENGIVTLNLACQYNGQGQSTLNYSLDAGRNLSADVAYDITLTKDIALSDSSTIAKDALSFSQDEIFNEETAAFTAGNSDGLNYQLYVPENAADGKDHPLIVWFHGGGEGGYGEAQNNTSQLRANRGALGFAEEGAQQIFGGAYVLAPQSPNSWSRDGQESLDHATALINTIVNTYNIDADRIYVAGCSDGGWMTVNMAIENPELFAAIVPICAAFGSSTDEELLTLKDNNIWMVHALNDTSVEPENTSDRLHALIPSSIYTVYDTVTVDGVDYPGHWSWIYVARNMPTHNGQSIFQWMASKTLADDPITDVEQPGDTETPDKIVQTSDNQMIYPYIGLMLLAVVGMGGYVVVRRQRKQEDM